MYIIKKIRKLWHDIYYRLATKGMIDFAMRCQDVVSSVDLGDVGLTSRNRFRLKFHFTLCQACQNYKNYSEWLGRESRRTTSNIDDENLDRLNKKLLRIFASKKD